MSGSGWRAHWMWTAGLACVACLPLAAQSTAQITGRIEDPSRAWIPDADVVLVNQQTGAERRTATNEEGYYNLPFLQPGVYRITVIKDGFRPAARTGIKIDVDQNLVLDVTLSLGTVTQTLEVVDETQVVAVDSATATLGTVFRERQAQDLPLNGRNFTQLLTLTTGVATIGSAGSWGNPQVGSFTLPSINGQSTKSTQWLLDGTNDSSPGFALISVAPVIDDIAEFKVISHADSAEYGGVLGGYVSVVSKSGENKAHGGLWEFLRSDRLDARNFFRKQVTPLKQNQFGGNASGPVVLPRIYDGRNKTFFYASYQGFRQRYASSGLYRVPTPAEMNGDLSAENPIFDPMSTRLDQDRYLRDPFPNRIVPASRIDPIAKAAIARLYPAPIHTGFAGTNGMNAKPNETNQDMWTVRGDHQTAAGAFSYRFSHVQTPVTTAGDGGLAGSTFRREPHGYNTGASYTREFGPSAVFHLLFGRSFVDLRLTSKWDNLDQSAFVPELYDPAFACGFIGGYGARKCYMPDLQIAGFAHVNEFRGRVGQTDIWEFKPDLSITHGRHAFKMGFGYAQHKIWAVTQRVFIGYDAYQTADLQNPARTGNSLASFLLGVPSSAERADSPNSMRPAKVAGGFFQDQWKVSQRLTINLGLRNDANILPNFGDPGFFSDPAVENQYSGMTDLLRGRFLIPRNPGSCAQRGRAPCIPTLDGSLPPHVELAPNGKIFRNIWDNWQPRIGLAFRITDRTVLRVGVGRFFDNWNETTLAASQSEGLWPDVRRVSNSLLNRVQVEVNSRSPLALAGALPPSTPFGLTGYSRDPRMKNPLSNQYNIGVEHQLSRTTLLSVNYVGSRGRRIPTGSIWNTAVTPGPGNPAERRPYSYIAPSNVIKDWSRNWYDSLQTTMDHKFSHGIAATIAYTWSKSQDLGSSDGFGGSAQDPYNLWPEKAVSAMNLPHVLSAGWVYELPFGPGRGFEPGNPLVSLVIARWQVNGMVQLTSGQPYGISVCGDSANLGRPDCYLRPNLTGDPEVAAPGPSAWFSTSAFAAPAPYSYGTLGRNPFRGDALRNLDLSLFRDFRIREQGTLQFRLETFNTTNSAAFGVPNGQLGNVNFGRIFATRNVERQLQLALKLRF